MMLKDVFLSRINDKKLPIFRFQNSRTTLTETFSKIIFFKWIVGHFEIIYGLRSYICWQNIRLVSSDILISERFGQKLAVIPVRRHFDWFYASVLSLQCNIPKFEHKSTKLIIFRYVVMTIVYSTLQIAVHFAIHKYLFMRLVLYCCAETVDSRTCGILHTQNFVRNLVSMVCCTKSAKWAKFVQSL